MESKMEKEYIKPLSGDAIDMFHCGSCGTYNKMTVYQFRQNQGYCYKFVKKASK